MSIDLVEVTATIYPAGKTLWQIDINGIEGQCAVVDGKTTDAPDEHVLLTAKPGQFTVERDIIILEFRCFGDGFGAFAGGIQYEVDAIGPMDVFEPWMVELAALLKQRLAEQVKRYPSKDFENMARIITAWKYHSQQDYFGEWDTECELLGIVEPTAGGFKIVALPPAPAALPVPGESAKTVGSVSMAAGRVGSGGASS